MSGAVLREVVVLSWLEAQPDHYHAAKIAEFLGARADVLALTREALRTDAAREAAIPRCTCLVVDAEALAVAASETSKGVDGLAPLMAAAEHVLVYGFQPTARHQALLQSLSSGALAGVQALPACGLAFDVAENQRRWCAQFSGISLSEADPARENVFVEAGVPSRAEVLIAVGGKPFFARAQYGPSQIFFAAGSQWADLDQGVRRHSLPSLWFSRLAPLMMFLRGALGNRLWHSERPRACFIIDDPLLKSHYGFVDYERLLQIAREHNFSFCIAFIPWNYRRSNKEVAQRVSSNYGRPMLCVHGCDHTGAEFAAADFDALHGKARLALERMRKHQASTGVVFDEVMVFPQGHYSAEGVRALKAAGFLAGINGEVCPSTDPKSLALRDLLDVAVTRFADFPLFVRRYPHNLVDLAFDRFLGKPTFVVEHHNYFRNGYDELTGLIERLNSLDALEWTSLAAICSEACLTRTDQDGMVHVRFYTDRFVFKNEGAATRTYEMIRRQAADAALPAVTVAGREWPCEREGANLKMRISLDAGQSVEIRLTSPHAAPESALPRPTLAHNLRVGARRAMCEFRDNYVDTIPALSRTVDAARGLRARGKSRTQPAIPGGARLRANGEPVNGGL